MPSEQTAGTFMKEKLLQRDLIVLGCKASDSAFYLLRFSVLLQQLITAQT